MKYEDLLDLVKTREGYTIEFKESVNSSLGKEMCAFANDQGGKIILGVRDSGEINGIDLSSSDVSKIHDIARNMNPSIHVSVDQIENLALIYVPDGKEKPYTIKGHFYLRQGANSQKLNRDEIRTFFQKENQISFERQTTDFDEKDFSNTVLRNYKRDAKLSPKLSKAHIMKNLNLLTNDKLNNVGVLFFTKHITKYFPSASVMCFLYSNKSQTDIIDSKEFTDDFLSNLENTHKYLLSKLNTAIIIKGELRNQEQLELPKEALRETIINAITHRDYFVNSNVQINISPDRLEIINPGRLLFPKNDFGKVSVRRNPILVDLVFRLGLVEKAGSGIKKIKRLAINHKTKIRFETGDFFKTVFLRDQEITKSDANPTQIRRKSDANRMQIRQNWIVQYLKKKNKLKTQTIVKELQIVKDTAVRDLNFLIERNIITKKGAGNNVWFELVKSDDIPAQIRHKSDTNPAEMDYSIS